MRDDELKRLLPPPIHPHSSTHTNPHTLPRAHSVSRQPACDLAAVPIGRINSPCSPRPVCAPINSMPHRDRPGTRARQPHAQLPLCPAPDRHPALRIWCHGPGFLSARNCVRATYVSHRSPDATPGKANAPAPRSVPARSPMAPTIRVDQGPRESSCTWRRVYQVLGRASLYASAPRHHELSACACWRRFRFSRRSSLPLFILSCIMAQ